MPRARMTGRERILAAVSHQEPDRVPISPRYSAWMTAEYGDASIERAMALLPDVDFMETVGDGTANYLILHPDEYDLPGVRVEQRRSAQGPCEVVERAFHTPAGTLTDRTIIAPAGREYGVAPNPTKTEHLLKSRDDLPALQYILPPINTNFDYYHRTQATIGDRGVALVNIWSALCHQAGDARGMEALMMDYYDDRALFEELLRLFQERTLAQTKAALEAGVEWVFANSYYNSLSAGWSPAIFAEVFAPQIRQQVELVHSYGARLDYYDDGKLAGTMSLIADCGVDVLETCTPPPVGDFDLRAAKQAIGAQTTLKGYVDLIYVMQRGTPELVEHTIAEAMQIAKPGGGFIVGSSDSFREGTPAANIAMYFGACRRYGAYD